MNDANQSLNTKQILSGGSNIGSDALTNDISLQISDDCHPGTLFFNLVALWLYIPSPPFDIRWLSRASLKNTSPMAEWGNPGNPASRPDQAFVVDNHEAENMSMFGNQATSPNQANAVAEEAVAATVKEGQPKSIALRACLNCRRAKVCLIGFPLVTCLAD